jgi:hypothetical protein
VWIPLQSSSELSNVISAPNAPNPIVLYCFSDGCEDMTTEIKEVPGQTIMTEHGDKVLFYEIEVGAGGVKLDVGP